MKQLRKQIGLCLIFFIFIFATILAGCEESTEITKVNASIASSSLSSSSLNISINSDPSKIAFSNKLPTLNEAFGSNSYDFYTLGLSGIINLDDAYINAIPTKSDGKTITSSDDENDLAYFTDYLTFSFKVQSDVRTIKVGIDSPFMAIEKNRLINGFYYLNFKYLYLSSDKNTAKAFDYGLDNFIYIETKNNEDLTLNKFILKLSYDLLFI